MNDKLRERIRSLLRVAKNKAATANEAAIALRRARFLMDEYQIDADELDKDNPQFEHATGPTKPRRNYPLWQQVLASQSARLNDCRVKKRWDDTYDSALFEFFGMWGDATTASLMYGYLYNTCTAGCREFLAMDGRQAGKVKRRNAFCLGFSAAIGERVDQILAERNSSKVGNGLILSKQAMMEVEFGIERTGGGSRSLPKKIDAKALGEGYRQGQIASLHRNISEDNEVPLLAGRG